MRPEVKAAEAPVEAKAAEPVAAVEAVEPVAEKESSVQPEAESKAIEPPRPTISAAEASRQARVAAAEIDRARARAMRTARPDEVSAKVEARKTPDAPVSDVPKNAPVVAAVLPAPARDEVDEVALREASEEAEARRAAKAAEAAKKAEEARRRAAERKAAERPASAPDTARPEEPKSDEPAVWRVLLSSVPPGAAVLVDGKSVGRTPMTLTWAPNKSASVWVTLAGFEPANFQVGERQNGKMMRVELIPVGGAAAEEP